jgi:serine/threonine-protein kinase PpkA
VKVLDFGIARVASADAQRDATHLTKVGAIMGTVAYMSPEQALGEDVDERTDLYALGVILHQMLTGEKPYVGDTTDAILEQHKNAPLPVLPDALAVYQPLLGKLLAKDPAQRYGSAREVLEALDHIATTVAASAPPPELPALAS